MIARVVRDRVTSLTQWLALFGVLADTLVPVVAPVRIPPRSPLGQAIAFFSVLATTLIPAVSSRFAPGMALFLIFAGTLVPARAAIAPMPWYGPMAPVVEGVVVTPNYDWAWLSDHLDGMSGHLRARMLLPSDELFDRIAPLTALDVAEAREPGIRSLPNGNSLITLVPFGAKRGAQVEGYRVGRWPYEGRSPRSAEYANPEGFILVTEDNQHTALSEHFLISDFLTHDQDAVWPKALVLREALIEKLELVIADLESQGISVQRMKVLSGFRHPRYNALVAGALGGAVSDSRHQYGDAADVIVDNDEDGAMDDLNRDGRVDLRDARVILAAVERVERLHPELTGGVGLYRGGACGPFAHVDARGHRARWGVQL